MKRSNISLSILLVLIIAISGCRKFVDIGAPKTQLITEAVFADSADATYAVTGIYSHMMSVVNLGFSSGALTVYPGLSSDELIPTSNDPVVGQFYNNQLLITNDVNQSIYTNGYKFIYEANACIEGLTASEKLSANLKLSLVAEARFLRAFCYFNLVNLYGDVPLITTTDYHVTRLSKRSSKEDVYKQIIDDLKFAKANLSQSIINRGRANYFGALALLAKTYLYTAQYQQAAEEADKIILSGNYALSNDLTSTFLKSSTEAIWSLMPVYPGVGTWEAYYFVPTSPETLPRFILNNSLVNAFESSDQRKQHWIGSTEVDGKVYYFPFKYKVGLSQDPPENSVVLRLAEVYLIRAEARANLNDINGAKSDVNSIRNRAGLGNVSSDDQQSITLAIEKERQAELFCEWGNRFFDLKRTDRATVVLNSVKNNYSLNAGLYPIPLGELNANPNLSQNPGY